MEQKAEGVCAVCDKPAALKCGGCKQKFYCMKSHQRLDWQTHKSNCLPFEIHENVELGRHLIATRDLEPGDSILSESPLVWGPALRTDQRLCIGCGKKCTRTDTRCRICLWPACDIGCPGLVDKNRHRMECSFLVKARIIPRCEDLLVIRMLILWRRKSKAWSSLQRLKSHQESRGPGTYDYNETVSILERVKSLLSGLKTESNSDMDVVEKICGLIDVNALETMPPKGCVAIYENACLLEHSCLANTRHSFLIDDKGRPRIIVKAACSIPKGSHLSTSYTHVLWATKARLEHLSETKYFNCECERCSDPTELNTHLGTMKCPQDDGLILPKTPGCIYSEWECDTCSNVLSSSEVSSFLARMEEEVDHVMEKATKDSLIELLSRLTRLLHPGHQLCITVSHSLIQLLPGDDPRKPELCKRIIKTTKTLDPYGVRLALYTAVALRELSTCPGEDRERLLSEAVKLLSEEPKESAGEKLRILIESEL